MSVRVIQASRPQQYAILGSRNLTSTSTNSIETMIRDYMHDFMHDFAEQMPEPFVMYMNAGDTVLLHYKDIRRCGC